jgi:hypothetical protein
MLSILKRNIYLLVLFFGLSFTYSAIANDWDSQNYLINGVYYLISQKDLNMAEDQFRKVIFYSSFNSLSEESVKMNHNRETVAEAFYFLGEIYYEKATSQINISDIMKQNYIAQAKGYLGKAKEYGIVYDRLHPSLLDEINEKYPKIIASIPKSTGNKTKVAIGMDDGLYQIDTISIDKNANIIKSDLQTKKESSLECGAIYKMKPDIRGASISTYKALTIIGIGLAVCLIRS